MMISVIIATRDRAALLEPTLDAIAAQRSPGCPFEVLVVDNASVDNTPAVVAAAAGRSSVPVVYLTEQKSGKSHALNTAVAHARGDLLVFTDDDVLPSPGWLAAYAQAFSETGADYAAGRILPLWEAAPPRWLTAPLHGVLAVHDGGVRRLTLNGMSDHVMPIGANMAIRRHVLDTIGGWNPDLGKLKNTLRTGEDHEFALRLVAAGFAGVYEPEASVLHRVSADRLRLPYFVRWGYGNGAITAGLEQDYPSTPHYVLGVPRYLWRRLATDLVSAVRGIVTFNPGRCGAAAMRLPWFAGYLRGRWQGRKSERHVAAQAAAVSRSSRC
jgi:glycosyltransferase involved in cell wall biosynthesis